MSFPTAKVIHSNWKNEVETLVKASKSQVLIINPFLQPETVKTFFSRYRGKIRVLTRFNLNDFYNGVSSLRALQKLLKYKAEIRGVKRLHAKVFTFDSECALVSSANLTDAAMTRNVEFGLITSSVETVKAIEDEFARIWDKAGPSLTRDQIDKWTKEVENARRLNPAPRIEALGDRGANVTTGGFVVPPEAAVNRDTRFDLENAVNFFCKFSASSDDRQAGTVAVKTWIEDCEFKIGGFYPKGKKPRIVKDGDVMFPAVLTDNPHDIVIIGRAYAMAFVEGFDTATVADWSVPNRDWKEDWPFRTRFRNSEFIEGTIADGVSLDRVMRIFGNDAFVTSQEAAKLDPTFKPQKSVRQHPYVRLTYEAAQWVNAQLDLRFAALGTILIP
jgi:HKD family nuclease